MIRTQIMFASTTAVVPGIWDKKGLTVEYATDVMNLVMKNFRLDFWTKIRIWPLLY